MLNGREKDTTNIQTLNLNNTSMTYWQIASHKFGAQHGNILFGLKLSSQQVYSRLEYVTDFYPFSPATHEVRVSVAIAHSRRGVKTVIILNKTKI